MWAVRRSLRLLTLLTLMASALCTGQSLADQEIAAPRVAIADSVAFADSAALPGSAAFAADVAWPPLALVTTGIFEDEPVATITSAIPTVDATPSPALSAAAPLATAPAAAVPILDHFSPLAERAPPFA